LKVVKSRVPGWGSKPLDLDETGQGEAVFPNLKILTPTP